MNQIWPMHLCLPIPHLLFLASGKWNYLVCITLPKCLPERLSQFILSLAIYENVPLTLISMSLIIF